MELRLNLRTAAGFLPALFLAHALGASTLGDRIDARIGGSELRNAVWGIQVEDGAGNLLYERNGEGLFIPASVRKLFSAAAVAGCHGLDARYRTELWLDGSVDGDVLHGNLIVRGSGDPSLGARYLPRTISVFDPFVEAVRALGIRTINGSVVADVSAFDAERFPGAWKIQNIGRSYAPPIAALAFNENAVGVFLRAEDCRRYWMAADPWFVPIVAETNCTSRTLSMEPIEENRVLVRGNPGTSKRGETFSTLRTISDPGLYAAQALEAALGEVGIESIGEPWVSQTPLAATTLMGTIESPVLYTLLTTMIQPSSNLFAEMLFKSIDADTPASWEGARQVERDYLVEVVGLDESSFVFDDGSGLSANNFVSPDAVVRLLRWMIEGDQRFIWMDLMAKPGESGTLRTRLAAFQGRLWGKTGTLDGVRGLAGYFIRRDGSPRYFTIFVNHYASPAWQAGEVIDGIVHDIDRY
jgi:serine-type D-Ala-D-Ala carboxypeptidase/endopeptidase (penicillin-binding protein 4)